MKIGIITFHKAENIGATLQAYALFRYIKSEFKADTEIIDFIPNNLAVKKKTSRRLLHWARNIITYPFHHNLRIKRKKYKMFFDNYRCSERTYFGDSDLAAHHPDYDLLISGSDQILNTQLSGCSKSFYLSFDTKATKISYASSFGRENISDTEYDLIKTELVNFKHISVREKSAKIIIENTINQKVRLVVDPVFLINKCEWTRVEEKKKVLNYPYIFVYAMELTPWMKMTIERVRDIYHLPVVAVLGNSAERVEIMGVKEYKTCGPQTFLALIRDAEVVLTNSFHGTAFSIIYQKPFFCIAHSSRNTRLENILDIVECKSKLIFHDIKMDIRENLIFPEEYENKMNWLIDESQLYIHEAIGNYQ